MSRNSRSWFSCESRASSVAWDGVIWSLASRSWYSGRSFKGALRSATRAFSPSCGPISTSSSVLKEYSGLTEEDLEGVTEIDATGLSVEAPRYEEINLAFLPEEKKAFVELLGRVEGAKTKARWIVAHYDDFGRLFDAIIAVKSKLDIPNGAVALRVMADLAMERLAEIERSDRAVP